MSDSTPDPYLLARDAAAAIAEASGVGSHDVALVLGSGWAGAADLLGETVWQAPATTIPGFRAPAVAGHVGTLRSVEVEGSGAHALVLGARTHYYEGAGVDPVVHGVRTAAASGCRTIVLTNGCGGIDPSWEPGTPVLIADQINHTGATPLRGATFVDMTDVYTPALRDIAREVDPDLPEGVYMQFHGPAYETPAEVRMARTLGATLVGMSTALEAIAAREAGLDVLGISLVTNLAAGISPVPLSHEEVLQAGREAGPRISRLLAETVRRITGASTEDAPA
ncbi:MULTISPECIES: purine-nucleoside phosphorylase [Brachybacterium]|uniref:Purine nucleoside phosphorylase n=1 Tax=Brachybacterium rhamnosum TaxID=173361 RepID=A0ABW4Q292_9MICO|nr:MULTISPECIES: purine-nucleoside phosphorylase [Brachybacterium]MCW1804819.1 purine-nucleoside phosphorylase [Brachybacterium squillarum]QCR53585.1 purine-nucleoside phosphorylase [Brachybacterium sp. SGAir0954]